MAMSGNSGAESLTSDSVCLSCDLRVSDRSRGISHRRVLYHATCWLSVMSTPARCGPRIYNGAVWPTHSNFDCA